MDWGADPGADVAVCELDPLVDAVEAAVAGLRGSDPAELGAAALAERIVRIEALAARLSAHQLECIEALDSRGDPEVMALGSIRGGCGSGCGWLRVRRREGSRLPAGWPNGRRSARRWPRV